MFTYKYRVAQSNIPGAGQGIFLETAVARGRVLVAPDRIDRMIRREQWEQLASDSIEAQSSARWFEDWYTLTPDWTDECYINHSSDPTGIWHLGFLFAARDLPAGTELTMDYRYVIGSGERASFACGETGEQVVGLDWTENLRSSAQRVLELIAPR